MPFLLIGLVLGGLGLYALSRRGGENSSVGMDDYVGSPDAAGDLADAVGWPYSYGAGAPNTPWSEGPAGVDCSGFVQMCLVRLGLLSSSATDRGAAALADDSYPVAVGDQVPGDMAYYPGHIVLVIGYPDEDGHSAVLSAGGHATTKRESPPWPVAGEEVKVHTSALYRDDFVTYMRLKSLVDVA